MLSKLPTQVIHLLEIRYKHILFTILVLVFEDHLIKCMLSENRIVLICICIYLIHLSKNNQRNHKLLFAFSRKLYVYLPLKQINLKPY